MRKTAFLITQAFVDHPYRTIKRQWGFDHIMTKKVIKAASTDLELMALAYNLRRMFNLGVELKTRFYSLQTALLKLLVRLLSYLNQRIIFSYKNHQFKFYGLKTKNPLSLIHK